MFAVKHIYGNGSEMLVEASQVNYYPSGCPGGLHPDTDETHVQCILPSGDQYIACYGDVFVMQGGKTVQRYPLGSVENWEARRSKKMEAA